MNKKSLPMRIVIFLIGVGIAYYNYLPPIHPQSVPFWFFLLGVVVFGSLLFFGTPKRKTKVVQFAGVERRMNVLVPNRWLLRVGIVTLAVAAILVVGGFVTSSEILHAGAYSKIIEKEDRAFAEDVDQIPWKQIPTVDRDTAVRLGNRKMGEVVELVSQFTVSSEYTQINYQDVPTRVSPLQYASLIKWFTNQSEGIPYYMKVNIIDGKTDLVKAAKPLRYTKSEHFNRHITRHVRFQYPFKLFYRSNFEVDDKGVPYWITPVYKMRVGLFGGPDVKEVILTNAQDGSSKCYPIEKAPNWIDCVYDAELLIQQVNWNGKYQRGFINSMIGQKGVLRATEGYNYLAMNDDVYLYTGITSVSADESNIGFILVNMRTKECTFYSVPSAEEFSAMGSAEGAVQEKKYKATFPLLINVNDRPTYFLSLKDEAGLIKMYAFIDAENYQHVVTASTVQEAYKTFAAQQSATGVGEGEPIKGTQITGQIASIAPVVIEGNTVYYFTLVDDEHVYIAPATIDEHLPFISAGDMVSFEASAAAVGPRRVQVFAESKSTASDDDSEKEDAPEAESEEEMP